MPIVTDLPDTEGTAGMTGEADWETLLDYTGSEVTEEVIRSWWGTVPPTAYPKVSEQLKTLDTDNPKLAALIRRVTGQA